MKNNSLEKFKTIAKRLVSNILCSITGLIVAVIVAGFSGLFAPFWTGPPGSHIDDPFGYAMSGLRMLMADATRLGWWLGAGLAVMYFIPLLERSWWLRLAIWTISGATFGYFVFGYVNRGDYSGLIMAPYGLYCGLLADPIHKGLWKAVSLLKSGVIRLREIEVGN